jgi:hypothetical protein
MSGGLPMHNRPIAATPTIGDQPDRPAETTEPWS